MDSNQSGRTISAGTLGIEVSVEDDTHTITLSGEMDLANADAVGAELERVYEAEPSHVVLDLRELEFIDSTGIAVLVSAHRRLAGGGRLRLLRSNASAVRRVMDVTGLDRELPFSEDDDKPASQPSQ